MTLSRRVQRLLGDGESTGTYQCGSCGAGFDLDRQACPRCGSYVIERSNYDDLLPGD